MANTQTKPKRINIWQFQFILARRLAWWSALSFAFGVAFALMEFEPFMRGFGWQAIVWGLINAAIAVGGALLVTRRHKKHADPADKEIVTTEANKLRRLLTIMLPLDVLYILIGIALIVILGRKNSWWLGSGVGVIVQGLYLLGFDWYHLKKVPVV